MMEQELKNFGLSDKEAKVYIAALELGTGTIQELSRKAVINRATTYILVESLKNRGLINYLGKEKRSVFVAEKPQRILDILHDRKNKLDSLTEKFHRIMPDFEAIYNVEADRPRVRFLDNKNSIIWNREIIRIKPKIMYYMFPHDENFDTPHTGRDIFVRTAASIREIKFLYVTEKKLPDYYKNYKNITTRLFPLKGFGLEVAIYPYKVLMSKPVKANVYSGVLIEDKRFYESFRAIFELLWQMSRPAGQELNLN